MAGLLDLPSEIAGGLLGYLKDAFRGDSGQARGLLSNLGSNYDPNRRFAQNALDPQALERATGLGMGFSGGGLGIKAYHGSPRDFPAFDAGKSGSATDPGALGRATYFSTDPRVAEGSPFQYHVDLNVKNPLQLEMSEWSTPGRSAEAKRAIITKALGIDPASTPEQITEAVRRRGHDAVSLDYSPLGYRQQEIAVSDPSLIEILRKIKAAE